ncbi:MAG: hypothetical protein ABH986_02900 [archaeon]
MKKTVFFLVLVILAGLTVHAETIKEETFDSIGYEEFVLDGANKEECREIIFYDEFNQEEFTVISVHSEFTPDTKGNAKINVFLNNELVLVIEPGKGKEFERITVKKEKLKEKNTLKLCSFTSDSITRINVFDDSSIGNYTTAFFPENSFRKEVISKERIVGNEIMIKTSLKNYGNEKTVVEIIDGDAERTDIELVKGNSSFKGEILPGQEISLEYTYRLKNENTRVLPNADAYYFNAFGEKEKIESNYPEIFPSTQKALEPVIMLKKQINSVGEKSEIEIVIINNSLNAVHNSEITLFADSGITFESKNKKFEVIQPKETVYFRTTAKSDAAGEFELGCELTFGQEKTECKKTAIIFEEKGLPKELIAGSLLAVIGIIIYAYLYLK